jgi:hypothetical protein
MTTEEGAAKFKFKFLQELRGATWTGSQLQSASMNFEEFYLKRFQRRTSTFQTMPPSAASKRMYIHATQGKDEEGRPTLVAKVGHDLTEDAKALLKRMPRSQIVRRGRAMTSSFRPLMAYELTRRTRNSEMNMEKLKAAQMPNRKASAIARLKIEALKKRLSLDTTHLEKYAKAHASSSAASGSKWMDADLTDRPFWEDVFEWYKELFENLLSWVDEGRTPAFGMNTGSRARAKLPYYHSDSPGGPYDQTLDRTRTVMFKAPLSSVFAFVPDKAGFYKEVLEGALDMYDFGFQYSNPLIDGGDVYQLASDAFRGEIEHDVVINLGDDWNTIRRNGKGFVAKDGANWEGQAGTLLGEPFWGTKTKIGDTFQIPSGVWDTSIDGTLAMMQTGGKSIPGLLEEEVEDTEVRFILGMQYAVDPLFPRTQGFKMSMDKADKGINIKLDESHSISGKHSTQESKAWLMSYEGLKLDGDSLLSGYKEAKAGDFVSGTKLRAEVLAEQVA